MIPKCPQPEVAVQLRACEPIFFCRRKANKAASGGEVLVEAPVKLGQGAALACAILVLQQVVVVRDWFPFERLRDFV